MYERNKLIFYMNNLKSISTIRNMLMYGVANDETMYWPINSSLNINNFSHTTSSKKILDLTDLNTKAIVDVDLSFFTFLFQSFAAISKFYSLGKNKKVVLYIKFRQEQIVGASMLKNFLLTYLADKNINFKIIDVSDYDEIKINNFYPLLSGFDPTTIRLIYSKIKKYVLFKNDRPFRKVFISRSSTLDERITNAEEIESFFKRYGFEIICPEKYFNSFFDQINYFNETKVLAGVSGSGLSNCIFMKPGGTVIELMSIFNIGSEKNPNEIHEFYRIMGATKNHLYISAPNLYGEKEYIFNSQELKKIIEMI